jgi:hypothetical protein
MASSSSHFEGALDMFLALDFAEISRRKEWDVFYFKTGVSRDSFASRKVVVEYSQ